MGELRNMIIVKFANKAQFFLKTQIWNTRLDNLSGIKKFSVKYLRTFLLAIRNFNEDKCYLRASALTFYSLLSIVPVFALIFAIAKGFDFQILLQKQLLEKFPGQQDVLTQVIDFSNKLLENTKGGTLAGFGVVLLFWSVIKVLGHIEEAFDDIWAVEETRSFVRKFSDYLSMMLICPVLILMSGSITVFVTTQLEFITDRIMFIGVFVPLILFALKFLPYVLIWLVFTLVYIMMPNIKVKFASAFFAGIIAGTIYTVVQLEYIMFQVGVTSYNAIYGSFAALPLFLVWLQISWIVVLFGAEFSFAHQNSSDTYDFETEDKDVSANFKKLLALEISHLIIKNFAMGARPFSALQISQTLEIPFRLVQNVLSELSQTRIISETQSEGDIEPGYQPARDINSITIKSVIDALDDRGDIIPVAQTTELASLSKSLQAFKDTIEKSPANILLKEI
jgi:membrane protein